MKFQTKVQYAEYHNNTNLRMETETVAHGNPILNPYLCHVHAEMKLTQLQSRRKATLKYAY